MALAAYRPDDHQVRLFEDGEVLAAPLTRHAERLGELLQRQAVPFPQAVEERAAHRVGERAEDRLVGGAGVGLGFGDSGSFRDEGLRPIGVPRA